MHIRLSWVNSKAFDARGNNWLRFVLDLNCKYLELSSEILDVSFKHPRETYCDDIILVMFLFTSFMFSIFLRGNCHENIKLESRMKERNLSSKEHTAKKLYIFIARIELQGLRKGFWFSHLKR